MVHRNNVDLRCPVCAHRCSCFDELLIHSQHLVIEVPFINLCPICEEMLPILKDCLQHILQHVSSDPLDQAKLIEWMALRNYKSTNIVSKQSERPISKIVKNFTIEIPTIGLQDKCLCCSKFFGPDEQINKSVMVLKHVLSHVISTQKAERVAPWFQNFFSCEESKPIVKEYVEFVSKAKELDSTSNLLKELEVFENEKTKTCRYCHLKLRDSVSLYSHYVERHHNFPEKYFNCVICNFKEANSDKFLAHIFTRHMGCYCGQKYETFDSCLRHVRTCIKCCPRCNEKFNKLDDVIVHLNKGEPVQGCPYCDQNMGLDEVKKHIRKCPSRTIMEVHCPLCKKHTFIDESKFREHCLHECKPWISNLEDKDVSCIEATRTSDQPQPVGDNLVKASDIQTRLSNRLRRTIERHFSSQ